LVEISIHEGALRIIPAATAASSLAPRPCGLCKGEFTVPDDFNAPLFDTPIACKPTKP
jgi:hypothetical protein